MKPVGGRHRSVPHQPDAIPSGWGNSTRRCASHRPRSSRSSDSSCAPSRYRIRGQGPVSWDRRPDGRAHPQHADRRVSRDWSRTLELLLVDPDRGMNLRNDVCHGLVDTLPKHRVGFILQAALYLLSHAHGHRSPAPPTP
ncbi:DUF4209 domain-containing protein [Streptomyces sp. NBC_00124]|nr:DUF4209 domain-containing protein [Streptomyces sp. NBC_00124]